MLQDIQRCKQEVVLQNILFILYFFHRYVGINIEVAGHCMVYHTSSIIFNVGE